MVEDDGGGHTGRWWAFVDEALWAPPAGGGCYLLAAAVIERSAFESARAAISGMLLPRQRRLHWRDESAARRRKLAATVAELPALHFVVAGAPLDPARQERARRKCLERLLHVLGDAGVDRVVLESRTTSLNAGDTDLVDVLRVRHALPARLRVEIEKPEREPLLWVADIVAGAARAARAGRTDEHLNALSDRVEAHDLSL